jgi:ribosomal protein S18 acetylase RimI-like enzyme
MRLAEPDDLADVQACVSAAFARYLTRLPLPPAALSADYAELINRRVVFVAVDPAVVGTVTATGDGTDPVITNLAVEPSRQGSGVGRLMMRFVEERAAERGCQRVTLFTHELMVENVSFYNRLGYSEEGRRVADGRSRVYLARNI